MSQVECETSVAALNISKKKRKKFKFQKWFEKILKKKKKESKRKEEKNMMDNVIWR